MGDQERGLSALVLYGKSYTCEVATDDGFPSGYRRTSPTRPMTTAAASTINIGKLAARRRIIVPPSPEIDTTGAAAKYDRKRDRQVRLG